MLKIYLEAVSERNAGRDVYSRVERERNFVWERLGTALPDLGDFGPPPPPHILRTARVL